MMWTLIRVTTLVNFVLLRQYKHGIENVAPCAKWHQKLK